MTAHKKSKPVPGLGELAGILDGLKVIAESCATIARERTKRMQIDADTKLAEQRIAAARDAFAAYLDRSFDERARTFDKLFANVDRALADRDVEMVAVHLNAVVKLAESSAFKDLASVKGTAKRLETETTWDF